MIYQVMGIRKQYFTVFVEAGSAEGAQNKVIDRLPDDASITSTDIEVDFVDLHSDLD